MTHKIQGLRGITLYYSNSLKSGAHLFNQPHKLDLDMERLMLD
ncbi:hypothetical protein [Halolactibacillus halophilus]|nr:hypothetical protein [Halolactibacillus halophilus]